jgi:hypothetical protein
MVYAQASALLLVGLTALVAAEAPVPADLQQAIRERGEALQAADAAKWERSTAEEFTLVDADGKVLTRSERLAAIKTQPRSTTQPEMETVRVYGDTAVHRVRQAGGWVIQVWVRKPAGWKVVATQLTRITKP